MGTEIERKFLVVGDEWRSGASGVGIRQAYLAAAPGCTVRIRLQGADAFLTIKGRAKGVSRPEFEYAIPPGDAAALLDALGPLPTVEKTRYAITYGGSHWVVDEFHGANIGLVLAEVELRTEDESFTRPSWLGPEVSHDPRYTSAALAHTPFTTWERHDPAPPPSALPVTAQLLQALAFAADKHRNQRRKDAAATPYVNHCVRVAEVLAVVGQETDPDILIAAVLHDTIEDTATSAADVEEHFGPTVRRIVEEVTDDKRLPKMERKRLQVDHAPTLSRGAKLIKLADKIQNVLDVTHTPPPDWSLARRQEYLEWTNDVVAGCRGVNQTLEARYDAVLKAARKAQSA